MENRVSNISFKSKIKFIPRSQFEMQTRRSIQEVVDVNEMHNANAIKRIKDLGVTEGIYYCLAGIFKKANDNKFSIFHFYPSAFFQDSMPNIIFNHPKVSNKKLKEALVDESHMDRLKGILIGGLSGYASEHYANLSKKMLLLLKNGIDHFDLQDFTVFFGQRGGIKNSWPSSSMAYSNFEDTVYINLRDEQAEDVLKPQFIKDSFDYIHISPNDSVIVNNQAIPNEYFNKQKKNV